MGQTEHLLDDPAEEDLHFWPVWRFETGWAMLARYVAPTAVRQEPGLSVDLRPEDQALSRGNQDIVLAGRLYGRLLEKEIGYGLEPWASKEGVQQIRHPWWLLSDQHGTCVDLSLTYAAMCLEAHVGALLVTTDEHALVVFEPGRLEEGPPKSELDLDGFEPGEAGVLRGPAAALEAALTSEELVAVDVVAVTWGAGFEEAREAARACVRKEVAAGRDVRLVDVPLLHSRPGYSELDPPSRSRPSIRMRVPAGPPFEEFPSHRQVVADLKGKDGTFALIGESGRGKSMLARHLAENARFGAAWFLDASDRKALLNSLAMAMQVDLGRPELEVPEAERKELAETALAQLRATADPWLVVLDNADDDPGSIRDLIPVPKRGQQLLITSTNEDWRSFQGCRAVRLPPVDASERDRFQGEEIRRLVEGRPLLLDAFSKFDETADWASAELPAPPADLAPELRGPAVYWALLQAHEKFGAAELRVAALAAFLPPNGQPRASLEVLVDGGEEAVDFLIERGLLGIDRNLGMVRMHRLFGAAVRHDLEAARPELCDEVVTLLAADPAARAALDEYGDLATVERLDKRLAAIDERTPNPSLELGVSLHSVAMLLELHGHTGPSGLTFERAERHLMDEPVLRADCLLGRARTINQHHTGEQELLEKGIAWAREARELKLAAKAKPAAYRALAMEGLLMKPLATFTPAGKMRRELLDRADDILHEADRQRQRLSDEEVPPAEKARSRYNLAGIRIPKAKESPARAAEHLEEAHRIYSEVAEWRAEIYRRMVHPHIAACINGLALVAYYRAMLLPAEDAQRSAWLREATVHVNAALKQREVLDGSVDGVEATKSSSLLAKIALARSASRPSKNPDRAAKVADEAMEELRRGDRLPARIPSFPSGRKGLEEAIDRWARSPALLEVVGAFGELPPEDLGLPALLEWLERFSERWDFRKGERNIGAAPEFPLRTQEIVEVSALALGLVAYEEAPQGHYDFVLILGGLARACLSRPLYTARLLRDGDLEADRIIAIGAFRSLSEGETELLEAVAKISARDEFEAMDLGIRKAFDLGEPEAQQGEERENPHASWRIHEYRTAEGAPLQVAAAPSSEPEVRRANTADTLAWLADGKAEMKAGQRLLIVTTDIYVPFQHADALRRLALPYGVEVEVAGVVPGLVDPLLAHEFKPHNYLQEIRSTIRALRQLEQELAAGT